MHLHPEHPVAGQVGSANHNGCAAVDLDRCAPMPLEQAVLRQELTTVGGESTKEAKPTPRVFDGRPPDHHAAITVRRDDNVPSSSQLGVLNLHIAERRSEQAPVSSQNRHILGEESCVSPDPQRILDAGRGGPTPDRHARDVERGMALDLQGGRALGAIVQGDHRSASTADPHSCAGRRNGHLLLVLAMREHDRAAVPLGRHVDGRLHRGERPTLGPPPSAVPHGAT